MKILVAGATGNIGSKIVPLLASQNLEVVAAGRDLEKLQSKFNSLKIDCRQLDFADALTWESALAGIGRMFFVLPPGSASEEEQKNFLASAKEAGVQHVVYSSGRTTGPVAGSPLNVTEELVKNSGMDWTILRPGWFMQNFIHWVGFTIPQEDAFYLPAGKSKTAFVDVRDIAAVAAAILSNLAGHQGQVYDVTSSEALDHHEVAAAISTVAGRTIKYVPLSDANFRKEMMKRGWSEKAVKKTTWLYSFVRQGLEEDVSPDVERILGRSPIGFQGFVEDYSELFG